MISADPRVFFQTVEQCGTRVARIEIWVWPGDDLTPPPPGWDPQLAGCGIGYDRQGAVCLRRAGHDDWHIMEPWLQVSDRAEPMPRKLRC